MPAAIPIIATVAAGAAASYQYYGIAMAITVAAQVATQALTKKPSLDSYRDTSERKQVLRAAASAKTVVYGHTTTAGTLFFSEEESGQQDDGEMLHLAVALAGHSLSSIGTVWLGDEPISSFPENASFELHTNRQTVDPYMLANCPSWKEDMIGKGLTWLRVSLKFSAEKFPSGIPNIKVEKYGRAVYDPRTGLTGYSNNAALVILDYYRNYLKVPDTDILWDQFKEAANICDEDVITGGNTVEKRYTINGEFDLSENKVSIARTMNVTLNLSGYRYRPGMYVKVNFPSIGIVNVEMRVTDWKFGVQNGVQLTLKQETADVWGDAVGKPIERPPFTQLPSGGVAQPQNLKYTVEEIGQVVQGILSWQNIGQVVYNKVVIRRNGQMVMSVQVPGTFTRLTGLPKNTYTAHVIAVNQMGAESPEGYLEFSIEAPPAPSHVDIEQGFFAVTLIPRLAAITNVSTQFDFWTSGETKLPNTSTETVEGNASREGMGTTWTSNQLQVGHTYYWYIRTVNAFGASGFVEVPALCSMDTGGLIDLIDDAVQKSDAFQNVKAGVDTNLEGIMENALANHGTVERQWVQYGEVRADILVVKTTVATAEQGLADLSTYVQASIGPEGSLTAAVNQKLTAEVNIDGTAKASYVTNLGIVRNGVKYSTGFGMSIEPSGNSYKSTVVFAADQFGIYSGSDPGNYTAAFFVYNGQVFIRDALIQDGSITNAKIGNYIQSNNFVAGSAGWRIDKNGNAELHGKLYADSGNFSFNGINNKVVIDGYGLLVNLTNGGNVQIGTFRG